MPPNPETGTVQVRLERKRGDLLRQLAEEGDRKAAMELARIFDAGVKALYGAKRARQ